MAYNTSKGDRELGDIKNEDDIDTRLDWEDDYIGLKTGGTTRLAISGTSGYVGIGINSPDGNLHVWGASAGSVTVTGQQADGIIVENDDSTAITLLDPNGGVIYFGDADDTDIGRIGYRHGGDYANSLYFTTNNSQRMTIDSSGRLGIGLSSPTHTLTVVGAISGSSTIYAASSISSSLNLAVTGAVHANTYYGDGSNLTGISAGSVSGSARIYSVTGVETSGYLKVTGSSTFAGAATFSSTLTASQGLRMSDNKSASFGNAADFNILHNATNTKLTNTTGHILIDNQATSKDIRFILGSDSAATEAVKIRNNSDNNVWVCDAAGNVSGSGKLEAVGNTFIVGNLNVTGNIDSAADLTAATITMSGFVVDADGDTNLKSLRVDDGSFIGCDSDTDLLRLNSAAVQINGSLSGSSTVECVGHGRVGGNLSVSGSTLLGVGSATSTIVSGMLTASQGMYLADNRSASFGDGGDFSIEHNGTNSKIDNLTGHLIIDNQATSKDIRFVLGSDSAATEAVKIRNNSNDNVWICDAAGNVSGSGKLEAVGNAFVVGNLNVTGNIDTAADLTAATITMSGFVVDSDGDTNLKSLRVDDGSFIGCDSDTDLMRLTTNTLQINGALSGSSLIYAVNSISSSGNLAVTGAIHANTYYGDGSNLSGISAGAVDTYTNASNNRIITSVDSSTINGESNLTFDGTNLLLAGNISGSNNMQISSASFNGDLAVSGTIRGRQIHITQHAYDLASGGERWIPFYNISDAALGSATYVNQMAAPFSGRLLRIIFRPEASDCGDTTIILYKQSDGTLAMNSSRTYCEQQTVACAAAVATSNVFNFTGSSHFSQGEVIGITIDPISGPDNANVTCVWEYDMFGV